VKAKANQKRRYTAGQEVHEHLDHHDAGGAVLDQHHVGREEAKMGPKLRKESSLSQDADKLKYLSWKSCKESLT